MKSYGNLAESFQRFCAVSGIAERNPRIQPGNIVLTMFHTRIHEKQDNCLVLIAPTARWILRKRTDAQSAAVPMKISYFNGRVVSDALKAFDQGFVSGERAADAEPRKSSKRPDKCPGAHVWGGMESPRLRTDPMRGQASLPESCFCSQSLPSTKRETMKVTT